VLQAAIQLADENGVESLTMRTLGQALGVEAMSLYRHVADKGEIVDGIIDMVFAEIEVRCAGRPWKDAMRQRAISVRAALARHPWAIGLMESRSSPGPATLRDHDAVIGCLRESGYSVELAAHAYSLMDSYIYGFALQQTNLPFARSNAIAGMAKQIIEQFPRDEYPHLAELTFEHVMKPGYDYGDEFEFGLDLILGALEAIWSTNRTTEDDSVGVC
jgi:AcrR family transcriptional regulator